MEENKKGFFASLKQNKKLKYGTFATITTVIVLVIIIILNIVFSFIVDRFNLKLDFTSNGKFSITQVSEDYIKGIDKDVSIYVVMDKQTIEQNQYYSSVVRMLDIYENINDKIKVEYIDLTKNPGFSSQFPDLAVAQGDIIFKSSLRNKKITISSIVTTEKDSNTQNVEYFSYAESTLTSAIFSVTSEKQFSVSFLTGHGESEEDAQVFINLLKSNNFDVKVQNLLTEEINKDSAYAIIAAPQKDFSAQELQKIDKYLTNDENYGKNLLYFTYPGTSNLPELNSFLTDWGITVGDGLIYETNSDKHMIMSEYFAILDYTDQTYSQDLIAKNLNLMSSPSVPLKVAFDEKSYIKTKTLVSFSDTSKAALTVDGKVAVKDTDEKGPFPALIQSTKTLTNVDGTKKPSSNVVVSAGYLIDKSLLSSASYGNSDYLIRLLNGLIDKDDNLNIAPKVISTQLNTSGEEGTAIAIIFMVIIPLSVVIAGFIVWLKRRSL